MTVNEFFTSLEGGATWSAGVAFKRSKALPLERWEIFKSVADLNSYAAGTYTASGAVAYPGQVCKVVTDSGVTLYYMNLVNGVLTPTLLVDEEGMIQTTLEKIIGSASVNVTDDTEGNRVVALPGADTSEAFQVFGNTGSGFGFLTVSGGSGGTAGIQSYEFTESFGSIYIPQTQHGLTTTNLNIEIYVKTSDDLWAKMDDGVYPYQARVYDNGDIDITTSISDDDPVSRLKVLVIGGAAEGIDQVARNAGIASGAIMNGDLVLTKVDDSQITIDMDALTPTSDNLANVIEGGNGVNITNTGGKLNVAVAGYNDLLTDVTGGNGIRVSGTGHTRLIEAKTSAEAGNVAEVKADGIYVPTPAAATVTDVKENDKVLKLTGTTLETEVTLEYDKVAKKIYLKGLNETQISEIDVDDFIKDGMLQSVVINTRADGEKELVFTWNTDSALTPSTTSIALKDLAAVYVGGNGINIAWDKDAYVMSIDKGANTDSKYITLTKGKIDLDFSTLIEDKSLATTTNVADAKNEAIKHTDDELVKYTTTAVLEETYATKEYADQAETDAVNSAKEYTDNQLKSYISFNDIGSTVPSVSIMDEKIQTAAEAATTSAKEYTDAEVTEINSAITQEVLDREAAIKGVQDQIDNLDSTYATDTELSTAVSTAKSELTTEINKKQDKVVMHSDIVIASASWVADGEHFKYEIGATGYSASCTVDLIPHFNGYNTILAAEVWPTVEFENQVITLYANKQPTENFTVDIREIPLS